MTADTQDKLSPLTRLLHWSVALFIIGLLAVGLYMVRYEAWALYPIHKSFGLLAAALIAARVAWRWRNGWPPPVREQGRFEARVVHVAHWMLLVGTIVMPISGLMFSSISGHGLQFFGLELFPSNPVHGADGEPLPLNANWSDWSQASHRLIGYCLVAAVSLHVLAALKHHVVDRDATLRRMLSGRNDDPRKAANS